MSSDATSDFHDDDQVNTEDLVMTFPAVQALVRLLEVAPDFRAHWEEVKWHSTAYPIETGALFTALARYAAPRLKLGQMEGMAPIFAFIEEAMVSPYADWSNGAATGFLEMVSNLVPSKIAPEVVMPLMGPASRQYCRTWAAWCGADAATLALWDVGINETDSGK